MLVDCKATSPELTHQYDVVVIGAGAVGLALAVKLAREGKTVALLEAGPIVSTQSSQSFFETASSSGHDLPGLHIGRFRCLGGTTNYWGGQLVPFADHIFEERPWINIKRWPLSSEDIKPYYSATYALLGMEKVIEDDLSVWREFNVQPPSMSNNITPFFTRWTPESNFAILFNDDIRNLDNLTVLVNAPVTALISKIREKVSGVELSLCSGKKAYLSAKNTLLACGTIETIRLLKLPLSDGEVAPWSTNPWLGVGFLEHIDCFVGSVVPINKKKFSEVFDNGFLNGIKYSPKLKLSEKSQRENFLLEASAHFVFNNSFSEHLNNLKILIKGLKRGRLEGDILRNPFKFIAGIRFILPMALRYLRYQRMHNFYDGGIQLRLTSEQTPTTISRVTLRNDLDALGMPCVDVSWQLQGTDIKTLAEFAVLIRDYLNSEGLATVNLNPLLVAHDPDFMKTIDDANHHMGGARMALNSTEGVVDSNLRVFGSKNLYVAGAAIYPASGFANPTFTAIAFGLRLADHLSSKLEG